MRKLKIITITLAIILVTLVAFGGVYIQTQNRMENKVKDYLLGRDLDRERVIELKVVKKNEEENPAVNDSLTEENYQIVKRTIEKRLKSVRELINKNTGRIEATDDYTISLNKENGTIRIEMAEDNKTNDYAYYITEDSKVEIKEKDKGTEIINDEMVKKATYTYTMTPEGSYQVYMTLELTKDGQAKIEEALNEYAILSTEVDEIEEKQKELEDKEKNKEETENSEETTQEQPETLKKIAVLTIAGTEYDVDKIEKNKVTIKIGSATTNNSTINNNMSRATVMSTLINSGKMPIEYELSSNRMVYSDILKEYILYFALGVLALIIVVMIIFVIKYKTKGLLSSISIIGFISIYSLILRYTNITISIEGIGAIILILIINFRLNQIVLNKVQKMNLVKEAVNGTYKELFLKLIPIMIISLVFCFSGLANLTNFGMTMFLGLLLIAIYNILITKTLLNLRENK